MTSTLEEASVIH